MTDTQAAYMAGIIDGEGCFTQHGPGRRYPMLKVTNTDRALIEWLHGMVPGSTIQSKHEKRPRSKPCWDWLVCKCSVLRPLIGRMLPYLKVKRSAAEKAIAFPLGKITLS